MTQFGKFTITKEKSTELYRIFGLGVVVEGGCLGFMILDRVVRNHFRALEVSLGRHTWSLRVRWEEDVESPHE